MNVKKTIKKIAAVGTGALLVGSTLLGASAANLEDFPQPFVTEDGEGDVQFVIGSGATDDYIGALDIAVSLQAAAVSEDSVEIPGSETEVDIEDGFDLSGRSSLYLGDSIFNINDRLRDREMPVLLADGEVEDEDSEDVDYSQEIVFDSSNGIVKFDAVDREALLHADLDVSDELWTYTVDLDEAINVTDLDTPKIEMLGKSFTFGSDSTDEEVQLFESDETLYLELNEPQTVEVEGESYELEILGGSSDDSNMILDINGDSKTVKEDDSVEIGGLDVVIEDLFATNIPELSVSANVFVGSEEIILVNGEKVEIGGEDVDGLTVNLKEDGGTPYETGSDGMLKEMSFTFNPADLDEEVEVLAEGESIAAPLFDAFEVLFHSSSLELDDSAKSEVNIEGNSDMLDVTFTNDDGDEYTFSPFMIDANDSGGDIYTYFEAELLDANVELEDAEGYRGKVYENGANSTIYDDQIIVVNEAVSGRMITRVLEVTDIDEDDGVEFTDLSTGNSNYVDWEDEISDDTDVFLGTYADDEYFELAEGNATSSRLYLEGGYNYIELGDTGDGNNLGEAVDDFTLNEESTEMPTDVTEDSFTIGIENKDTDGDILVTSISGVDDAAGTDNDNSYYLTEFGTYAVYDGEDDEFVNFFVPLDEDMAVEYNAFIAPTDAEVVSKGAEGGTVKTEQVNPFSVGLAVRDTDVNLAAPADNLIVVGGPCINSVAAELMYGDAEPRCGADSGIAENEAIVQLFDLDNEKVAMVVAGWEAIETQAASRAVATGEGLTGDSAKMQVTSATNYNIVE